MKPATAAAKRLVREAHEVRAVPKATIEWEHNRFSPFASPDVPVTVTPAQALDYEWTEVYKLPSIVEPNRPRTGIAKARFDHNNKLQATGRYRDTPQEARFYLHGQDDPYTYWSSTQKTQLAKNAQGGYNFDAPIELTLLYADPVVTNKIVIGFETSYAKPTEVTIETSVDGLAWFPLNSIPTLDAEGKLTVWRDINGNWMHTPQLFNPVTEPRRLRGLRVRVHAMNLPYSHLDVLQMGYRLEADVSPYIENYSRQFELSDRSFISPLGGASSNVASLNLSNIDGVFNNHNEDSPFFGLIGKKAKVTVDLVYDSSDYGGFDKDTIRELTMWVDSWTGEQEMSSALSLKDSSIFLQEMQTPKVFWGSGPEATRGTAAPTDQRGELTVGAIIWQLMDLVGMSNYAYSRNTVDLGQIVPYFWPEEETTVWDQIADLAEGTQTAVYFDEYDVMQIKTRRALFGERETIDWNLDAIRAGQKLPDIIDLSIQDELVANDITINYEPAKYSVHNNGFPQMETVWEPEDDTVTLRATHLTRDLLTWHKEMWLRYNEVGFWPYECLVNIRGENIRYKGKEYWVHLPSGPVTRIITSQEEKQKADEDSHPDHKWRNSWSGKVVITERGVGGTPVVNHHVRPAAYDSKITNYFNTVFYPLWKGEVHNGMNYFDGTVTLVPPHNLGPHDYMLVQHETAVPSHNAVYGMKVRFPEHQLQGNNWATGGLFFAGDWGDAGWYLELSTTETIESENRTWRHEISLQGMRGNQPHWPVWGINGDTDQQKGFRASIMRGVWYDVEVRHVVYPNGDGMITAYLNGVWAGAWGFNAHFKSGWADQGKFGMFTRWMCRMEVESLYAINLDWPGTYKFPEPDVSSLLDLTRGSFTSGFIEREWRYGRWSSVNRGPWHEGAHWFTATNSWGDYVLDEFGPIVHEIREFEVVFEEENVPCSHSYLYLSNTAQVVCTDYYATPHGAKFTLVNTSRTNAIVHGDDEVTYGPDNSVKQNIFIYGRVLKQEDEKTVEKKDKASIRKNGPVTLEFSNRFIQTEEAASELGQWVIDLWAGGVDEIDVSIFGNPFIQVGDLVTINYPIKDMRPATHKYFVVSLENSFTQGLETRLTLRRARI